ncbi:MAG: hypothetical protein OEZ22_13265 [Spirochaetia bacterium]|nr:hypothetical protein [Spirochaetia bacterium]
MKKIKILVTALVLSAFILPLSNISATRTRAAGMGLASIDEGGSNAWAVDGLQPYIYDNPAALGGFKNTAFFEASNGLWDNFGGIIINPMGEISVGLFSGIPAAVEGFADPIGGSGNWVTDATIAAGAGALNQPLSASGNTYDDRSFGFLAHMPMGKMNLGFGLDYTGAGQVVDDGVTPSKTELSQSETTVRLGFNMEMGGMIKSIDAGLAYSMLGVENTATSGSNTVSVKADSGSIINFHARANMGLNEKNLIHILLSYNSEAAKFVYTDPAPNTASNELDGSTIGIGVSDEIKVSSDAIVFVGFKLEMVSGTSTRVDVGGTTAASEFSGTVIPFFIGAEGMISENWTGRFGLSHNIMESYEVKPDTTVAITQTRSEGSDAELSVGLSYAVGNFTFDWLGNVDVFRDGPDFVSGISNPWSTSFAATFNFGEGGKKKAAN